MRRTIAICMILSLMMLACVGISSAAVVDITSKVTWNSGLNMYVPNSYAYSLFFDGYTPANERVFGGLFLNAGNAADRFEVYLSNSLTSAPGVRMDRVTLEKVPELDFNYSIVDKGSLSSSMPGVNFKYTFTTKKAGFPNDEFLDWQLGTNSAQLQDSAHPGSIFYALMRGTGALDMDEILAENLRATVRAQGYGQPAYIGGQAPVAAPELPPIAMPLLAAALGIGIYVRARIAR